MLALQIQDVVQYFGHNQARHNFRELNMEANALYKQRLEL
jgi:hypothetical protein